MYTSVWLGWRMTRKLVKYYKIWFLGVCLQKKLTFELVGRVKRGTLSNVSRHHAIPPWTEGLNKQKDKGRTNMISLFEWRHPSSAFGHRHFWFSNFCSQTRTCQVSQCKESSCQCRRCGFDPWVRKIPWERNGSLVQYSCLGNLMDREARWAIVHGVTKESDITLNPGLTGLRATSPWFSLDSEFHSQFSWFSSLYMADYGTSQPP